MSHNLSKPLYLIGAGYMAIEYAKVLAAQNVPFITIGRSEKSCKAFEETTGLPIVLGGVESYCEETREVPEYAIVAVNIEELARVTSYLLKLGVKHILLEKPAGLDKADIRPIAELASQLKAEVYVAYNRRFYASTLAAQKMIEEDGGVDSFHFEFTEWSHQIVTLNKTNTELGAWFLANSTHVIDLAFFLGGEPKKMDCYVKGTLDWYHPAAVFAGSGVSEQNALFSYQANWRAPGRWSVEILTRKHRYYFKPMEKLQIQNIGSVAVNYVEIDDSLDTQFKPGLYLQVEAFLASTQGRLLSISKHLENCTLYEAIERGLPYSR